MSTQIAWTERLVITKDPDAEKVYTISGERLLAAGAEFAAWEFIIVSSLGDEDDTPLEIDEDELVTGNRQVRFRMTGGTVEAIYTVTFRYTTDETPAQIDDYSWQVPIAEQ